MANNSSNDPFLSILAMNSYHQDVDGHEADKGDIGGWAVVDIALPTGYAAAGFQITVTVY